MRAVTKLIVLSALVLLTILVSTKANGKLQTPSGEGAVQDSLVIKKVLKAVKSYVLTTTKDRRRPLVVKDGKKRRRFIVMGFPENVTQNKNMYTAEVDTDEFDHKIPRILYVDVKASKGTYKVTRIRIGPNRFRN